MTCLFFFLYFSFLRRSMQDYRGWYWIWCCGVVGADVCWLGFSSEAILVFFSVSFPSWRTVLKCYYGLTCLENYLETVYSKEDRSAILKKSVNCSKWAIQLLSSTTFLWLFQITFKIIIFEITIVAEGSMLFDFPDGK